MTKYIDLIDEINISDRPDSLFWTGNSSGICNTKDFWKQNCSLQPSCPYLSKIWQSWIPPKVSVFLWRLRNRALSTDDRVRQCGIKMAYIDLPKSDLSDTFRSCSELPQQVRASLIGDRSRIPNLCCSPCILHESISSLSSLSSISIRVWLVLVSAPTQTFWT